MKRSNFRREFPPRKVLAGSGVAKGRGPAQAWLRALSIAGLALSTQATWCNPISRCESADGRVVYSDEPCPSGTRQMRTVDEKSAVEVLKPVEHAHDARSAGSVRRTEPEAVGAADGARDPDAVSELRKRKLAECDDLVHRIEYAQRDLSAASEAERASVELSLRRLQAEHTSRCVKPR
jgi:hypothetical protein